MRPATLRPIHRDAPIVPAPGRPRPRPRAPGRAPRRQALDPAPAARPGGGDQDWRAPPDRAARATGRRRHAQLAIAAEQARGAGVDSAGATSSAGLILHELVTGREGLPRQTPTSPSHKIAHEDPDLSLLPRGPRWEAARRADARSPAAPTSAIPTREDAGRAWPRPPGPRGRLRLTTASDRGLMVRTSSRPPCAAEPAPPAPRPSPACWRGGGGRRGAPGCSSSPPRWSRWPSSPGRLMLAVGRPAGTTTSRAAVPPSAATPISGVTSRPRGHAGSSAPVAASPAPRPVPQPLRRAQARRPSPARAGDRRGAAGADGAPTAPTHVGEGASRQRWPRHVAVLRKDPGNAEAKMIAERVRRRAWSWRSGCAVRARP
jgi:hypothetical protein